MTDWIGIGAVAALVVNAIAIFGWLWFDWKKWMADPANMPEYTE